MSTKSKLPVSVKMPMDRDNWPEAASIMTSNLIAIASARFWRTKRRPRFAIETAPASRNNNCPPLFTTTSAASTVNCNPHEIAMPTSAAAIAGPSLRPSPSMPTAPTIRWAVFFSSSPASSAASDVCNTCKGLPLSSSLNCRSRTQASFPKGRIFALKSMMPTCAQTARAASSQSPVSMDTPTPSPPRSCTAAIASDRTESSSRSTIATSSSMLI
mmetsp:Transcript_1077/g.2002  ORF Transcript_1077/g.2002 Transcript_1077/m.2002 type:complete len:215 (-) Transcript_1077:179-823(-)